MDTQVASTQQTEGEWSGGLRPAGMVEAVPGIRAGRVALTRLGLLAAAVSLPIWVMSPLDFDKFGDIKFGYVMGIGLMAAGVVLANGLWRGGFGYRTSPWLWGLGALMLIGLVASLSGVDPVAAVNGNAVRRDGFLMMLFNAMLFLTAYRTTQGADTSETDDLGVGEIISRCTVAAAVPVWVYALIQAMAMDPYRWEAFRGADGRVFSTLGNPVFLGAYSAMVVVLALGLWMRRTSRWAFVWLLAAGLGVSVTVFSAARAAWIGLVVGLLALLAVSVNGANGAGLARFLRGVAVVCVCAGVVGGIVLAVVPQDRGATLTGTAANTAASLSSPVGSRNGGRLAIWAISARMIAAHPLVGVGPDLMGAHFEEYRTSDFNSAEGADRMADKPHSSVLEWTVETGMLGGVLFSALVAGILFVVGSMLLRTRPSPRTDDWAIAGVWAAAIAYAVQSLVTVSAIGVDGVWWVLLGLLAGWSVARGSRAPKVGSSAVNGNTVEHLSPHRGQRVYTKKSVGASAQGGLTMCASRRRQDDWARQSGFTLIELLVVIIIIAILAAIAIPTYLGTRMKAQDAAAVTLVRNALTVIESANVDKRDYSAITGGDLSAIEPAIVWNTVNTNLVTPSPPSMTNAVVSSAGAHGVDFYGQTPNRFDVASISESGNAFGIEVVSTGSAGASYVKVKEIEGQTVTGW